jgi:D-amino peptidase
MKVYISCDMEGVAGVADWDQAMRDKKDYKYGRELMVGEVNAAVEGAVASGASEVIVNDSHGSMINLLPDKLHKAAQLLQGRVKPMSMMQGLDESYGAVMFVGYHSMADTQWGSLSHTYSGAIKSAEINGRALGEPGFNGALAGYYGVPLIFLSGDEAATKEVGSLVRGIETVAVKRAYGRKAILSVHPELAQEMIRSGVKKAFSRQGEIKPLKLAGPYELGVELSDSVMGDICERIPGVKREGATRLSFTGGSYLEVYKAFLTIMSLSQLVR